MKDLETLAQHKHFHTRVIQRDGHLAFIAGNSALVNELADQALEDPDLLEINRHQLDLFKPRQIEAA